MNEILLNVETKEIRCAHLKNGQLHDLLVERKRERQMTGNIHKGYVTNILHNIQSAFIDIGEGENGFIHISDIIENIKKFEEMYEMDFDLDEGEQKQQEKTTKASQNIKIDEALKPDQPVIVQVVKEAIGTKGARLTSKISLPGRYLVMLPNSPHRGVSRKIENRSQRDRLKKIIRSFELPETMGLICRTASQNASQETLYQEAQELISTWQEIMNQFSKANKATLLFEESDILKRALLTAIDKRYERLLIDDYTVFQQIK
ncbi:MAG TPA: ribonuclease E/G, partial [Chlamydiales bacterium]|nr:ribonuclease E/G [Chlamydiales bacterium]